MRASRARLGTSRRAPALALLRLGRPLFLAGGLVFHALGAAAALAGGAVLDPAALLWAQVAITATQLVTHFSNEYFDLDADRATPAVTPWSGGSRVLADGLLPPAMALRAALVAAALALAGGLALDRLPGTGPATLPLVLLALAAAWSYSAPPLALHRRGLGEVAGALLLAGLTPLVGFYAQAGWPPPGFAALLAPLVVLQVAMLVTVSLPDAPGDAAVGKRTLAARLGVPRAGRLAAGLTVAALLAPLAWIAAGRAGATPGPALAIAAWLPLGLWQAARLRRLGPRPPWASLGFWAIGLVMGPAASVAASLAWAAVLAR